jgi:hypothetical protein
MTSKSMFTIILKVFGLLIFKEILLNITDYFFILLNLFKDLQVEKGYIYLAGVLCALIFKVILIYFLLFKTSYVMQILKLNIDFEKDAFSFEENESNEVKSIFTNKFILTTAILIITGVVLINEVAIISTLFYDRFITSELPINNAILIPSVIKIVVVLLLIGEHKTVINFLDKKND